MFVLLLLQGGYTHFMEKEIFEQAETIAQTMQGRVKITPLSPMKYAVPGIDPYLMPRVRMGGLVDHVAVSGGRGLREWLGWCLCILCFGAAWERRELCCRQASFGWGVQQGWVARGE